MKFITSKKILIYWLIFLFLGTLASIALAYFQHNPWKMGDWLINYEGGFIRRGLSGQIFIFLSSLTKINPGKFAACTQALLYFIFLFFSYLTLKESYSLILFIYLIYSPFIFSFQVNDIQGGCRKEILYFALLAFYAFIITSYPTKVRYTFFAILLFYPILILSHEMLAVFLPYLIIISYIIQKDLVLNKKSYFLILINILVFLFIITRGPASQDQIQKILYSLNLHGYPISGGIFNYLDKPLVYGFTKLKKFLKDYLFWYPQTLALVIAGFLPLKSVIKNLLASKIMILLLLSTFLGSIPLFLFAIDWGRWIYIHAVSLFFVLLVACNSERDSLCLNFPKRLPFYLLPFYAFGFYIPHCCNAFPYKTNFFDLNYIRFVPGVIKWITSLF